MSNVLINGRSAVHADSGGTLMTMDICLTKIGRSTVPIPYPNVAVSKDADKTASSVLINGQPACTQSSVFAKSKGDEPGNRKGIKSRKKGAEANFLSASHNVQIEGEPAARALDLMVSNAKNTPPAPLMQSVGLPPLAKQVTPPNELEPKEPKTALSVQQDGAQHLALHIDIASANAE
ncbi:DUF4150 domain-containing protein [Reinekea sp.]